MDAYLHLFLVDGSQSNESGLWMLHHLCFHQTWWAHYCFTFTLSLYLFSFELKAHLPALFVSSLFDLIAYMSSNGNHGSLWLHFHLPCHSFFSGKFDFKKTPVLVDSTLVEHTWFDYVYRLTNMRSWKSVNEVCCMWVVTYSAKCVHFFWILNWRRKNQPHFF